MVYPLLMITRAVFLATLLALAAPASAEVQKFMTVESGHMHPYFRLKFTPPKGWVEDKEASKQNGLPIYVPEGEDFGSAPALMPRMNRPPDIWSNMAEFAATNTGCCWDRLVVPVPSRICSVSEIKLARNTRLLVMFS